MYRLVVGEKKNFFSSTGSVVPDEKSERGGECDSVQLESEMDEGFFEPVVQTSPADRGTPARVARPRGRPPTVRPRGRPPGRRGETGRPRGRPPGCLGVRPSSPVTTHVTRRRGRPPRILPEVEEEEEPQQRQQRSLSFSIQAVERLRGVLATGNRGVALGQCLHDFVEFAKRLESIVDGKLVEDVADTYVRATCGCACDNSPDFEATTTDTGECLDAFIGASKFVNRHSLGCKFIENAWFEVINDPSKLDDFHARLRTRMMEERLAFDGTHVGNVVANYEFMAGLIMLIFNTAVEFARVFHAYHPEWAPLPLNEILTGRLQDDNIVIKSFVDQLVFANTSTQQDGAMASLNLFCGFASGSNEIIRTMMMNRGCLIVFGNRNPLAQLGQYFALHGCRLGIPVSKFIQTGNSGRYVVAVCDGMITQLLNDFVPRIDYCVMRPTEPIPKIPVYVRTAQKILSALLSRKENGKVSKRSDTFYSVFGDNVVNASLASVLQFAYMLMYENVNGLLLHLGGQMNEREVVEFSAFQVMENNEEDVERFYVFCGEVCDAISTFSSDKVEAMGVKCALEQMMKIMLWTWQNRWVWEEDVHPRHTPSLEDLQTFLATLID